MKEGPLAGYEIVGVRMCLDDGSYHQVDSSEMAFRIAGQSAFRETFRKTKPVLLEPVMLVEIETPLDFQGPVVGDLNARRGVILGTENRENYAIVRAEVPLANMFGYVNSLRSLTQGRATFSMTFERYEAVPFSIAEEVVKRRREEGKIKGGTE